MKTSTEPMRRQKMEKYLKEERIRRVLSSRLRLRAIAQNLDKPLSYHSM
jgi:hypothetical protein